ncbi:hypothetical protein SCP_1800600 [Sparassis crispa]|uniref:Uncharacterized protein n=1 Tax=Sparassis crispa TaxID=139825 RepID=A0A401H6G0_9APHY|nr:hypothetical protein SCP_1800600 [Sparassis crispa]GBE90038.1 hypothetical protein SCP_1800600 [Sparassis crispa]
MTPIPLGEHRRVVQPTRRIAALRDSRASFSHDKYLATLDLERLNTRASISPSLSTHQHQRRPSKYREQTPRPRTPPPALPNSPHGLADPARATSHPRQRPCPPLPGIALPPSAPRELANRLFSPSPLLPFSPSLIATPSPAAPRSGTRP